MCPMRFVLIFLTAFLAVGMALYSFGVPEVDSEPDCSESEPGAAVEGEEGEKGEKASSDRKASKSRFRRALDVVSGVYFVHQCKLIYRAHLARANRNSSEANGSSMRT